MNIMCSKNHTSDENPFTDILGEEKSFNELIELLIQYPQFDDSEKSHKIAQRKFYATRLFDYFVPTLEQVKFAENLHNAVKLGYRGRNPLRTNYVTGLCDHEESRARTLDERCAMPPARSTARSYLVTGQSGMGKTEAADRILRRYRQARTVQCGATIAQVVWLKIETPKFASLKQLCIEFFHKLDLVLGTTYQQWYSGLAADAMVSRMSHLCRLHAIGVLVIDEIQHLLDKKSKSLELRNFVTKLVNQLEIPIVMIGTKAAKGIFDTSLVQARRASGFGSLVFNAYPNDEVWREFVETMWEFQWTATTTPLSDELVEALYRHCQGVTDILIILFVLAQQTAMEVAANGGDPTEAITPELIDAVAACYMTLVHDKIQELANGVDSDEDGVSQANAAIRDDLINGVENDVERRRALAAHRKALRARSVAVSTASQSGKAKAPKKPRGKREALLFDPPERISGE